MGHLRVPRLLSDNAAIGWLARTRRRSFIYVRRLTGERWHRRVYVRRAEGSRVHEGRGPKLGLDRFAMSRLRLRVASRRLARRRTPPYRRRQFTGRHGAHRTPMCRHLDCGDVGRTVARETHWSATGRSRHSVRARDRPVRHDDAGEQAHSGRVRPGAGCRAVPEVRLVIRIARLCKMSSISVFVIDLVHPSWCA